MFITRERKVEVAWILLKNIIKKEGVILDANKIKRDIGNKARELGVAVEELRAVFAELLAELTQEVMNELKK